MPCINFPQYTDCNDVLLMDRVLRYESLSEELDMLFQDIGVPFSGSLGVEAKAHYRKDRRSYRTVLSKMHRETVARHFIDEIEMHRYEY